MDRWLNRPPPRITGRRALGAVIALALWGAPVWARPPQAANPPARTAGNESKPQSAPAEARLLEIYRLIGGGHVKQALDNAQLLVRDVPTFPLAQLVYGDLLMAQVGPLKAMGSVPDGLSSSAPQRLDQLRMEAQRRLSALREPPPTDAIPTQFIELPPTTRNAIAVDASRSRLYLFENGPHGLRMVASHYVSIGRLGAEKSVQGDQRTPIGVYYITSRLDARQLTNFYGIGALPLNYPNEYDRRLGRTGSGIWLHGVPTDTYARTPHSTDGCVVLANPELASILDQVQPRSTPVVIAKTLEWVPSKSIETARHNLRNIVEGWRVARASGDLARLMSFYSPQFASGSQDIHRWRDALEKEVKMQRGRGLQLKDVAILGWRDKSDVLVVTFGEVAEGQRTGAIKRQYWGKESGLWKIFYEGVIG